jgi:hypothetical protein
MVQLSGPAGAAPGNQSDVDTVEAAPAPLLTALRSLDVSLCPRVSDNGVLAIARNAPHLQRLMVRAACTAPLSTAYTLSLVAMVFCCCCWWGGGGGWWGGGFRLLWTL